MLSRPHVTAFLLSLSYLVTVDHQAASYWEKKDEEEMGERERRFWGYIPAYIELVIDLPRLSSQCRGPESKLNSSS